MKTRIFVIADADGVFVRCEACGLTCAIPEELTAAGLRDFMRHHRPDVEPALHPAQCPEWARAVRTGG